MIRIALFLFLAFFLFRIGGPDLLKFFLAFALILYGMKILWRKFYWKVSRRLALSYFLVAVTAFIMGLSLLLIAGYVTGGLILQYEVDSSIQGTMEEVRFWHDRLRKFPDPQTICAFRERFPGADLTVRSNEGTFRSGETFPMEPAVRTRLTMIRKSWHLIVNDPGVVRMEIPLDDIITGRRLFISGMEWMILAGHMGADGNMTADEASKKFPLRVRKQGGWLDRPIVYWAYVWSLEDKLAQDHPLEKNEKMPVVILRSSPRDIYSSLTLRWPGMTDIVLYVLITASSIILILGGIAILLAATTVIKINRSIHRLSTGGQQFAKGELSYRIRVSNIHDELGRLSLQFNRMAESIEKLLEEEKIKNQMLKEIEIASSIQYNLLPANLSFPNMDCVVHFQPCERVGGDYYDAFTTDSGNLFVIGDASGHGVPAAMLMSIIKSAITVLIKEGHRPDRILRHLHDFLAESVQEHQFITLQMVEISDGHLDLYNAGHPPPVILGSGKMTKLDSPSLPVGMLSGPEVRPIRHTFQQGDLAFFYTDGLYEAINDREEEFGLTTLYRLLEEVPANPQMLINRVLNDLDAFRSGIPYPDDLTLVSIKSK